MTEAASEQENARFAGTAGGRYADEVERVSMGTDTADGEQLTGLSFAELEALADGLLAPARQVRLNELLALNAAGPLGGADDHELDRLLGLADQLTILKARARYTLDRLDVGVAS